jgi:hypothetical protein
MLGDRRGQFKIGQNGTLADMQIGQGAGLGVAFFLMTAEYEVENHFQFQLYSNSSTPTGNDQSHTRL